MLAELTSYGDRMFTKLGCDVHTANDGQQAIDSILSTADPSQCLVAGPSGRDRSPSYDLVCMDGNMPVRWRSSFQKVSSRARLMWAA